MECVQRGIWCFLPAAGGAYAYKRLKASKTDFTGTVDTDEKNI